jgi:hypothetical protein
MLGAAGTALAKGAGILAMAVHPAIMEAMHAGMMQMMGMSSMQEMAPRGRRGGRLTTRDAMPRGKSQAERAC